MRRYSELIELPTFEERFEYLRLDGEVGAETFGFDRYLNQAFYHSSEWKAIRRMIILRDNDGDSVLDLAHPDYPIAGQVLIHHLNPVSISDIRTDLKKIIDPEFLVAVSKATHNAIHYGDARLLERVKFVTRTQNDTCPWR